MKRNTQLLERALRICMEAHAGQVSKVDGTTPYYLHPVMVAMKLARHDVPDEVLAAAFVHDVLEDTDYPEEKLREELGDDVVRLVKAVTQDDALEWKEKKLKYIENVRSAEIGAKLIAAADKIHNLERLLEAYDSMGDDIWSKFNKGREDKEWFERMLLDELRNHDHPIVHEFFRKSEEVKKELNGSEESN